jgi:uncharacterized membrane protein (UPF0127 family)
MTFSSLFKVRFGGWWRLLMLSAVVAGMGACSPRTAEQAPTTNPVPAASTNSAAAELPEPMVRTVFDRDIQTRPNSRLQTIKLYVGAHELETELALTELQIRTGMMFRTNILEHEAMLFVFPVPHQVGFWMKNVQVSLSCAYIDSEGVILETHDMTPFEEAPIDSESARVQFVLETKQGWFERHGIGPGVLIRTERGSLRETFFQPRRQ